MSIVFEMYKYGNFPFIDQELENPRSLSKITLKLNLENLKKQLREQREQIVIKFYSENLIKNKHPELNQIQVEKAATQIISSLYNTYLPDEIKSLPLNSTEWKDATYRYTLQVIQRYNDFKTKIMNLYNSKDTRIFPENLIKQIDNALAPLIIREQNLNQESVEEDVSDDEKESEEKSVSDEKESEEDGRKLYLIQKIVSYNHRNPKMYEKLNVKSLKNILKRLSPVKLSPIYESLPKPSDPSSIHPLLRDKTSSQKDESYEQKNLPPSPIYVKGPKVYLQNVVKPQSDSIHPLLQKNAIVQRVPTSPRYEPFSPSRKEDANSSSPKYPQMDSPKYPEMVDGPRFLPHTPTEPPPPDLRDPLSPIYVPSSPSYPPSFYKDVPPQRVQKQASPVYVPSESYLLETKLLTKKSDSTGVLKINSRDYLSPRYRDIFEIDGLTYPSVSFYIITILISKTGVHLDYDKKGLYVRGMSVANARKMLMRKNMKFPDNELKYLLKNDESLKDLDLAGLKKILRSSEDLNDILCSKTRDLNNFMDVDEAELVYREQNNKTFKKLEEIYSRKALVEKFKDVNLQNLLLITNKQTIVWDDPKNLFIGFTKKDNIIGKVLMDIRDSYEKSRQDTFPFIKNENAIVKFMAKDAFMQSWINMRSLDMCNNLHRFIKYINKIDTSIDIDEFFVSSILDNILFPFSIFTEMSRKIDVEVPEFFRNIILNSKGIPPTPDDLHRVNAKIKRFKRQKEQTEETHLKIEEVRNDNFDIIAFAKRQQKQLDDFLKTNPTKAQREVFLQKQSEKAKEVDFNKYITDLEEQKAYSPVQYNLANIKNKDDEDEQDEEDPIKKLEKLMEQEIELEDQDEGESKKNKKEDEEKLKDVEENEDEEDENEEDENEEDEDFEEEDFEEEEVQEEKKIRKDVKKFKKYEKIEGLSKEQITESTNTYKKIMKELDEKIKEFTQQKNQITQHLDIKISSISKVYWYRIYTMILFIFQQMKQLNEQDIRKIIVSAEVLNSETFNCRNTFGNLYYKNDNCIASALINIVIGIVKFKVKYTGDDKLSSVEIDLASSIILNKNISGGSIIEEEREEDINLSSLQNNVELVNEVEEKDENDAFEFRMGPNKETLSKDKILDKDLENVKIMLRGITRSHSNIDSLSNYFIKMVQLIKKSKISEKTKKNRINFFATIY
jgi:hypothetical protein